MKMLVGRALFSFALSAALLGPPCGAEPSKAVAAGPIDVAATLRDGGTIVLGEPVTVQYTITSSADERLRLNMGAEGTGWLAVSAADEHGVPVAARADNRFRTWMQKEDDKTGVLQVADPGERIKGYVVRSLTFVHPGDYMITVQANLRYGSLPPRGTIHFGPPITDELVARTFQYHVDVLQFDSAAVESKAEELAAEAASLDGGALQQADVEALVALPEAEALPSWQALAGYSGFGFAGRSALAEDLSGLNSESAVDVIAEMVWSPAARQETVGTDYLMRAYVTGGDAVKRRIRALYAEQGVSFPANPAPMQAYD